MPKLNQIIAVEKSTKTRAEKIVTDIYQRAQKSDLFDGISQTYTPNTEDGEQYPPEAKRVQMRADEALVQVAKTLTDLFDVTAAKDLANCKTSTDVKLPDNTVLMTGVPATYLLFVEKQLTELHAVVSAFPTLDESANWDRDAGSGLYKTQPFYTYKTKKVKKALVLHPATDKHPAQTQAYDDDVTIGKWEKIRYSGALAENRKKAIIERIETLQRAVKFAREEANEVPAPEAAFGKKVFDYLFGT